jgi:hypothetical protein
MMSRVTGNEGDACHLISMLGLSGQCHNIELTSDFSQCQDIFSAANCVPSGIETTISASGINRGFADAALNTQSLYGVD